MPRISSREKQYRNRKRNRKCLCFGVEQGEVLGKISRKSYPEEVTFSKDKGVSLL